jgi:hypothetical protein
MAGKIQDQLLNEFGGLFDGVMPAVTPFGTAESEVTQSLAETVTELGKAVAGVTPGVQTSQASPSYTTGRSGDTNGPVSGTESLAGAVQGLERTAASMQSSAAATSPGASTHGQTSPTNNSGSATSVASIATTFLESGFGIVPLITGLIGLFSGGSSAPPALEKYTMPSSISFESAETSSGLSAADFDQTGAARLYGYSAGVPSPAHSNDAPSSPGAPASGGGAAPAQITVNVQAMDAQSFMDYSSQIAQAVRGAMLNLSSLNDVVNEL